MQKGRSGRQKKQESVEKQKSEDKDGNPQLDYGARCKEAAFSCCQTVSIILDGIPSCLAAKKTSVIGTS